MSVGTLASIVGSVTSGPQACVKSSAPPLSVRKAIGWALRQYAKTAPEWVEGFVRSNSGALSPLSQREALRRAGVAAVTGK